MHNKKQNNLLHFHINSVLTSPKGIKNGIYDLKQYTKWDIVSRTSDRLITISPNFFKYFYGNPFPKEIENVGVLPIQGFHAKGLKQEIQWFFLSIKKYNIELSIFLYLKQEFEKSFIIGNYINCQSIIDKIVSQFGFSIWSISSQLLIYEYTSSQDKAKIFLSEILEFNTKGLFTSSLLHFLSQKAERKLSAYRYDTDLNGSLNFSKSNLDRSNKDYYSFQLNFFEYPEFNELKDILTFDFNNSIIDRYLTFRKLVLYSINNGIDLDDMVVYMRYIQNKIPDNLFNNINLLLGFDEKINKVFFNNKYLGIIDLYYSGLYKDVINEIKNTIVDNPDNFTYINLYSRSLVLLNENYKPLIDSPCFLNELAENIYRVYKRTSNPVEPLYSLYQQSKNIDSFDLNFQLNPFIKKEQNFKLNQNYFYLTLPYADPKIIEILKNKPEKAEEILNLFKEKTFESLSINYKLNVLKEDFKSLTGISINKQSIDYATFLFNNGELKESLDLWKKIFKDNLEIPPIKEVSINYIFQILNKLEKIDDCIKWYTDNYIYNTYSVYKIETDEIHKKLKKGRFKNVSVTIYLPIFISLISSDENEKGFALELFCKKNDAKKPSDLISNIDVEKDKLFEVFYNICCSNETLGNYRHIHGTKEQLEERINICNFLAKEYPENKDYYIQELNLLTNELIIYEGTQKLEDSKIYANDQAILNRELNEFEGLYNRYITIAGLYLKNIKILTVNKNELRFLNKKNDIEYGQNDIEYSAQAHIDSFSNIFSVIRDRFLYSKFGIVTYISTRIRHGVFLGELRPELEKKGLIFFKNKLKDKYEPKSYWLDNSSLSNYQREALISKLSIFSEQIDNLITSIIKNNIQIRIKGENELGWFNYDFSFEELDDFSVELYYEEDYKKFCKKVLEKLWIRTDENLEIIRNTLKSDIKGQFIKILNELESGLHDIFGSTDNSGIFTALSACSTNLQNKIDKIATWFKRSGSTHADFRLEPLIRIICTNVQKSFPIKRLTLNLNSQFNKKVKGDYYEHFNDFLRIFVDNMLRHSKANDINCNVSIKTSNEILQIILENDNPNEDINIPLGDYGDVVEIDIVKLVTEGRSGFMKAVKTIKDDLKNEDNKIFFTPSKEKFIVSINIHYLQLIV